ncbi:lipid A deacylase LpxR family protein, partial [Akkermansiaceae bacterium]|nr:lipid A deacylase LpxR family protein [Akkermansiaceae bacterium]
GQKILFVFSTFLFSNLMVVAEERGTLELQWENDTFLNEPFGIGDYNDRHYTNGLLLKWMGADGDEAESFAGSLMKKIWPLRMETERVRTGFSFGHQMYTPEIISTDTRFAVGASPTGDQLQVNDQPYAGYLFAELLGERRGMASFLGGKKLPARDRFELSLGLVGPGAGGHDIQRTWHKAFLGPRPDGWSHQLNNEITLNVHADRTWLYSSDDGEGLYFDVMPNVGVDLGNLSTRLTAGLEVRVGLGQIHDFLLPSMERQSGDFGAYLYASAESWLVGQNIFLDGNTFSSSHSVNKNTFVSEVKLGFGINGDFGDLDVAWVRRSDEFDLQTEADTYLSASFTMRY